jgi:hypothetical protein
VSSFSAGGSEGGFRGGSPSAVLMALRTAFSVPVTALIGRRTGLGRFGYTASTFAGTRASAACVAELIARTRP